MISGGLLSIQPASATLNCSSGLIHKHNTVLPDQDRAFGACITDDRPAQQARITADCVGALDQKTAWFHDTNLHYTNWCAFSPRASIVSTRY